MGSLPNLRDLEREIELYRPVCRKYSPHYRQYLTVGHEHILCQSKAIRQTRSMGNYNAAMLNTQNEKLSYFLCPEDANGCSPLSTRSTRSSCTLHHHIHNSFLLRRNSRQRDSMSSSGGASSVRRLIAVVRSTPSKSGPIYSRRLLFRNFAALCLGHAMITAAFVPLFTLQGSISVWWWQSESQLIPNYLLPSYDVGSLLLTSLFAIASISTLVSVFFNNRLGTNWSLILSYVVACIFMGVHLYPNVYTLIPAYLLMGIWFGPLVGARIMCLMTLATKLTFVMTEEEEGEVDHAQGLRKTEVLVHKLFRGLHIAQDFGLVIGNLATYGLIWYNNSDNTAEADATLDTMFALENNGERICGSAACPLSTNYGFISSAFSSYENMSMNTTTHSNVNCKTSTMLISVFLGFCVMGVAVTAAFMDRIKITLGKETTFTGAFNLSFRMMRDAFKDPRLQLAAPLAVFIGLEQGYMYSDFSKSYVACVLGVNDIPVVFLSLGVLQSIAAFTLSLLIQHIRRHIIIAVGFIFQSCLLLVLFLWKPSKEDPALFYVVPSAWGVCNAIWDTLSFSLMVSVYPDNWQAPFAHYYFFRFFGLALSFGVHGALCNWVKLYGLTGAMILAIAPYTWLELKHESKRRLKSQLTSL